MSHDTCFMFCSLVSALLHIIILVSSMHELLLHHQSPTLMIYFLFCRLWFWLILNATFGLVTLLKERCQTFYSAGPPSLSLWTHTGGRRARKEGREEERGWGWGGVTIELSTHTRPPLVTCVGLGQKKGWDAHTHTHGHTKRPKQQLSNPKCQMWQRSME